MSFKTGVILLSLAFFLISDLPGQTQNYSKAQIIEDVNYLRKNLIKYHPNLYCYSTPIEQDSFFTKLLASIPETVESTTAFQLIASISSLVKDGHTYIQPSTETINRFYTHQSIFPLQVFSQGQKMYLLRNFTDEDLLEDGAELISINGVPCAAIIDQIQNTLSRDGHGLSYPNWVLNAFFPAYYSFSFGHPKVFEIEFKDEQGNLRVVHLEGLTHSEIQQHRKNLYPTYAQQLNPLQNGITLRTDPKSDLAQLTIKSFNQKRLKKDFQQSFKKTIKAYFKEIQELGISNLIIDLRGNQGGALSYGHYLLRHLMQQPFRLVEGYAKVDKNHSTTTGRTKKVGGPLSGIRQPSKASFSGQVFVFVDGGSFSCSAIVANALQQAQRAIIIGEETGGSAFTNTGGPYKKIICPHTKIQCTLPTLQYLLPADQTLKKTSVLPNVPITSTIQDHLMAHDPLRAYVLAFIQRKK